jgi:hypothetical protein
VLAADVAIRAWFALAFPIVQASDYAVYYAGARVVAGLGGGSLDAMYSIFPKLWLGAVFRLLGDDLWVIALANGALHCAALGLLYAATRRIFGEPTALLAACWPRSSARSAPPSCTSGTSPRARCRERSSSR